MRASFRTSPRAAACAVALLIGTGCGASDPSDTSQDSRDAGTDASHQDDIAPAQDAGSNDASPDAPRDGGGLDDTPPAPSDVVVQPPEVDSGPHEDVSPSVDVAVPDTSPSEDAFVEDAADADDGLDVPEEDVDDVTPDDVSIDADDPAAPGGPGAPCNETRACEETLACVRLAPTQDVGFCAPRCEQLHQTCGFFGPGTHAECTFELPDGGFACGFVCVLDHGDHVHNYSCPTLDEGRMRCERVARDHGHRYCAPPAL